MAEPMTKRKDSKLIRSASAESSEVPSDYTPKSTKRKIKKPRERWLLTRKTWRYMADAGRKLIPDGAQNKPEDLPKIEAYFQEVCRREPKFLLWRKNSYPGALSFRKKRKDRRKGGSCRKASSADEADDIKPTRPNDLFFYPSTSGGRFDIQKLKYDFLYAPPTSSPRSFLKDKETFPQPIKDHENDDKLLNMLENYLKISDEAVTTRANFDYQELADKLQKYLNITDIPKTKPHSVHFEHDPSQKILSETLSRYYRSSPSREKIISDLLTNRKMLEKLYFDLRLAKTLRNRDPLIYKSKFMSDYKKNVPPPLIEIQGESFEPTFSDGGVQTSRLSDEVLAKLEEEYKKNLAEEDLARPSIRRRSSVDNDDVSQSVSDTIKRYLRMARKKSGDADKADRFKRVNYDRNLRNIKAKGEITKPGDDDGLNKGCQTNDDWILAYRDLKFDDYNSPLSESESRVSSTRSSIDAGVLLDTPISSPTTKTHHSFLSHLLHGKHDKNVESSPGTAMQKSKSSSSVVQHGSKLMAKSIFKRSKSQTRPPQQACSWIPKGSCVWNNLNGKQVILGDTTLQNLTEIERKVLQKVALAKLQALNLGVSVKIPCESVGAAVVKKRRPYLLKRKALTTGIFDTGRKEVDKEKGSGPGLVFGIPLSQCVENDRISRLNATGNDGFNNRSDDPRTIGRTSSRASFSSLIDSSTRLEEKESCLVRDRIAGSIPGLLDTISCGSTDILASASLEDERAIPHVLSECIRHLEANGLHTLGIFRVSSSKKRVRQLREDFDNGKETLLVNDICPHDVATLLKEFLRDLPDPLLCRDLYYAFVQTQKIRNRRLQMEALQHLVQLLPTVNRDTLSALLSFLSIVARNSNDHTNPLGEVVLGNKMNTLNLATVFAPNILHLIKQGKESTERSEDRIDVINVIRIMLENHETLFYVPAELLDEVYMHMLETHPEALEESLNRKDASTFVDESQDEVSDGSLWSPQNNDLSLEDALQKLQNEEKPRKVYSREEFLHESAATGGPNVAMRIRHKERLRERSMKKRREESNSRLKREEDNRSRDGVMYSFAKTRSSSLESSSSLPFDGNDGRRVFKVGDDTGIDRRKSTPYMSEKSGVITASLTIPVQTSTLNIDDDIPYIEDGSSYVVEGKQTVGVIRSPIVPPRRRQKSTSGSDSSVASAIQPITGSMVIQGYDSALGSSVTYSSPPHNNTPSSIGSGVYSSPPSWASTPPTSPDSQNTTVNYIPEDTNISYSKQAQLQKASYSSTSGVSRPRKSSDIQKCPSTPAFDSGIVKERLNPGITSIGNAVLRSRTADFERITRTSTEMKTTTTTTTVSEKKKYTKRRYTDSRHPTRHIPDSDSLNSRGQEDEKSSSTVTPTVYKRREIISSVPTTQAR